MTIQTVYRFRCDAPHCTATQLTDDLKDVPDGWRTIKSTDHIPVPAKTSLYAGRSRGTRAPSYTEQCRGAFTIHLCPDHPNVFDEHLPQTHGIQTRPGRDGQAYVSCSCGLQFGLRPAAFRIAAVDMSGPHSYTENAWWRHLPADLQWYAERETA